MDFGCFSVFLFSMDVAPTFRGDLLTFGKLCGCKIVLIIWINNINTNNSMTWDQRFLANVLFWKRNFCLGFVSIESNLNGVVTQPNYFFGILNTNTIKRSHWHCSYPRSRPRLVDSEMDFHFGSFIFLARIFIPVNWWKFEDEIFCR